MTRDPIQGPIIEQVGGIVLADGAVPRWWLWATALTVALAAGTWLWRAGFEISPGSLDRYLIARTAALEGGELVTDQMLLELAEDDLAVRAGARAYRQHCARCHGARGEGDVGPNLTDPFWIAGGAPIDIYATIVEGRNAQGMPPWGSLGRGACKQLTAFLLTIRDHNLPGKPPQGARWQPTGGEDGGEVTP
jgi:cytochrome c oxidase cbb3-type subunit III